MRNRFSFSIVTLALITTVLMSTLFRAPAHPIQRGKESAYERVMRTRTLRCGYAPWPVTEAIEPNTGKLKGVVPELTEALGKKLGLNIEWREEIIWGQQAEALNTGRIDALCSSDGPWTYTSAAVMDYTEPMLFFPLYLYGRQGGRRIDNLDDINSERFTLSSMEGDISLAMALDRFPKARRLELPGSADPSLVTLNVMTGKADFVINDPLTVAHFNRNNPQKLEKMNPALLATMNMSFSVGKGQGDLVRMLNQGFHLLQQLGISDQILDKYDPGRTLFFRPAKRWEERGL